MTIWQQRHTHTCEAHLMPLLSARALGGALHPHPAPAPPQCSLLSRPHLGSPAPPPPVFAHTPHARRLPSPPPPPAPARLLRACAGGDVFERIEGQASITEKQAADLFRQMVRLAGPGAGGVVQGGVLGKGAGSGAGGPGPGRSFRAVGHVTRAYVHMAERPKPACTNTRLLSPLFSQCRGRQLALACVCSQLQLAGRLK